MSQILYFRLLSSKSSRSGNNSRVSLFSFLLLTARMLFVLTKTPIFFVVVKSSRESLIILEVYFLLSIHRGGSVRYYGFKYLTIFWMVIQYLGNFSDQEPMQGPLILIPRFLNRKNSTQIWKTIWKKRKEIRKCLTALHLEESLFRIWKENSTVT